MQPIECEFESEVLAAVVQSRWPGQVDGEGCSSRPRASTERRPRADCAARRNDRC